MDISRAQALAHRVAVHQFDGSGGDRPDVLRLGVQDTPYGTARQALAARGAADAGLPLVWTARGAPHLHVPGTLPALAKALWPLSDADARARIRTGALQDGPVLGLEAFRVTAAAFREVVKGPMSKGEVSTQVSARVPEELTYWCASCDARHISGAVFQHAGIAGGVQVVPEGRSTVLKPLDERFPVPKGAEGTDEYVLTFLRLLGPATATEAAKFLGTTGTNLKAAWQAGELAEVTVDGRKRWIGAADADALTAAPPPEVLRLLPPGDPYLQTRDRPFLVPDKKREKEVWRTLGSPGAVLLDGEIAGTWRAKLAGKRLEITVSAFERLPQKRVRAEVDRIAALRGAAEGVLKEA